MSTATPTMTTARPSSFRYLLSSIRRAALWMFVEEPLLAETLEQGDQILRLLKRLEARDLTWERLVSTTPTDRTKEVQARGVLAQQVSNVLLWSFRALMTRNPGRAYMEIQLPGVEEADTILVTVQRVAGDTPHQRAKKAERMAIILAENLKQHSVHGWGCNSDPLTGSPCTCGLDQAIRHADYVLHELKPQKPTPPIS